MYCWALIKTLAASDDSGDGQAIGFASKVALSENGNVVAVSAWPHSINSTSQRGAMYVYNT